MNIWKTSSSAPTPLPEMTTTEPPASSVITSDNTAFAVVPTPPNNNEIISRIKSAFNSAIESVQAGANYAIESVKSGSFIAYEKVQSLAGRVKDLALSLVSDVSIEMTKTKIEQITLICFAAYTGIGARILAGGFIPTSFFQWTTAAPLFALSAASIWYAANLVDYDNPEKIEKIRKKAQKMPLPDVIHQFGWQNVFTHQILSPAQFQDAFKNLANSCTFKDLFTFAKIAKAELAIANSSSTGCKHQIPALVEWVDTFHHETAHLEPSEILAEYPFSDLQTFGVLKAEELAMFEKANALLEKLNVEKEIVLKKLDDYAGKTKLTASKIESAFSPNGSIDQEFQILGDGFHKMQSEIIDTHQKNLSQIGKEINELATNYNSSRSSRPIKA